MKIFIFFLCVCLIFLSLFICYGQNLSKVEQKIAISCDMEKGIVHNIPKFEVAAWISNDTLYSEFVNQSLDTVVIRLCTTVLKGSQVSLYRIKSENEKPVVRKELYTLPFTNFLFFDPLESSIFPTKFNRKNLQDANYAKYELFYFLPSIRKGGIITKWSYIQKFEKDALMGANIADSIDEPVYKSVTQMPEFPGGQGELMRFLAENTRCPFEGHYEQGCVIVKIIVEKDGSVTNAQVVRSSGEQYMDREALRVVKSMPKWSPGYKDGKPVRVYFSIPVMFRLQ